MFILILKGSFNSGENYINTYFNFNFVSTLLKQFLRGKFFFYFFQLFCRIENKFFYTYTIEIKPERNKIYIYTSKEILVFKDGGALQWHLIWIESKQFK